MTAGNRPDAVTFGETMVCMTSERPGPLALGSGLRLSIAGAESNVAIGLARLGHRVCWVGTIASDSLATVLVDTLRGQGVDVTHAVRRNGPTGLFVKEQRLPAQVKVHYYRRGSAGSLLGASDVVAAIDQRPRLVHVTGVTAAVSATGREAVVKGLARAKSIGVMTSFDVNHRSSLWTDDEARSVIQDVLGDVDILLASEDELDLAAPEGTRDDEPAQVARILSIGVTEVVVKRGPRGATAYTAAGAVHRPAPAVQVRDPVGAGDAFAAGYLSAWLDGLPVPERLDRGVTCSALCVAVDGDWEGLPSRFELDLLGPSPGHVQR